MTFLTCPVCAGQMREQERQGVTIDVCSQCRGVWLDRGELEKLASAVAVAPQAAAPLDERPGRQPQEQHDVARGRQRRNDDDDDEDGGFFGGNRRRGGGGRGLLDFFD